MTVKLNAYINFEGKAEEALGFYQSVFGGEVHSDTFRSFASESMPVQEQDLDKIMHGFLKGNNGIEIMASDAMSGMPTPTGGQIQLSVSGDDEELLKGYWEKLSEGGTVTVPMDKAPWGDTFGMLVDKYGISWMVDINPGLAA